ncbi:NAD(P)-binding domain-containing protein [Flavobacterium ustbae]|uniref:NAD(P)-binding domain-containing protein n=1 Tax=Flavobacterium ustbae TaxID=2488790 RepID=UPI000F79FD51|nr:NAD(P)-binding domain-containing protein [Flavobacterium ustbae]
MKIGIIGIGTLTLELAFRASKKGHTVLVHNPRGNTLVRETISKEESIKLSTLEHCAESDLVILFVPKHDLEAVISGLPDMTGRTVIHTSGLILDPKSLLSGLSYAMTYKITAALLPDAHVVKLFKPMKLESGLSVSAAPEKQKEEIFYISSNATSGLQVKTFLSGLHFEAKDLSARLRLHHTGLAGVNPFLSP